MENRERTGARGFLLLSELETDRQDHSRLIGLSDLPTRLKPFAARSLSRGLRPLAIYLGRPAAVGSSSSQSEDDVTLDDMLKLVSRDVVYEAGRRRCA